MSTTTFIPVKAQDLQPGMRIGHTRRLVVSVEPVRRRRGWVYVLAATGEGRPYPAKQEVQVEETNSPATAAPITVERGSVQAGDIVDGQTVTDVQHWGIYTKSTRIQRDGQWGEWLPSDWAISVCR